MRTSLLKTAFFAPLVLVVLLILLLTLPLGLPSPNGPYEVGETVLRWIDSSRPEVLTEDPSDVREVVAVLWYPAEKGTGTKSPYFPGLSTVSKALIESGEVSSWEVFGLQWMHSQNLLNAHPAKSQIPYPILIFSPGNGTNVEFYNSLASEVASHGYVVVGLNHPYDVAGVELTDHKIAQFYKAQETLDRNANQAFVAERIKVRTLDVLFARDQLEILNATPNNLFTGMLDVQSVAVGGHSLGGITASEACKAEPSFRACFNLDGIQRGGPFSPQESASPPEQPFLFLTKELRLPPKLIEKFESTKQSYWIVIRGARHGSFTDGPLLQPNWLPIPNQADHIMALIQRYTLAFLEQALKGQNSGLLSDSAEYQDVRIKVYPSH